jgi:hypothetical protein
LDAGRSPGTRDAACPTELAVGKPLAEGAYEIEAGKYYRLPIRADGSQELQLVGPEFFRNVWINEVVINKIEVRPLGLDSIEFDAEGEATITFVPAWPLRVAGTGHDGRIPARDLQRERLNKAHVKGIVEVRRAKRRLYGSATFGVS